MSYKAIQEFIKGHPTSATGVEHWHDVVKQAAWLTLADTRTDFLHADLVGRRTVFNISGNNYRMITRINYASQKVFILHILTHKEYDEGKWK